jgi:putative transposase
MGRPEPRRLALQYIAPGKRMQNPFIESFGRFRDELLNETLFTSPAQAYIRSDAGGLITTTHDRTHSSKKPSEFAMTCHPVRI